MKLSDPSLLKTDAFINGEFVSAPQDKRFTVTNPSTGEPVAQVADFGTDGITAAIAAAEAARIDTEYDQEKLKVLIDNDGWA